MKIINLYSGYEGSGELILKEKNIQTTFEVHLLDNDFYDVLSLIPLGQYNSESVMYNYFRCEGWYDGEWECKRIQEFLDQLNAISASIPIKLQEVYNVIKQICQSVILTSNKLFITLE